ncbi:hypothetical protein [Ponticoccus alexandrii]|uniref:Arginine transporter n=1 Tax=Ponticoccus alexandrii TaxID=1943633 RepID=A0ABX7F5P5_9RHOB|nr:hypothetical protein [Ponticoccus alexandrii]ETA53332.2 arginine transporter [Rhodobacteraceae bacterium PD-2]QRF65855.1 arginine transporter [Ponticoccus alexandrii]
MKTTGLLLLAALALGACGGGANRADRGYISYTTPTKAFATGPVSNACLRGGRKAASTSLCGCVQAVADRSLSGSDQRLAAKFFADPHHAQEIRQSDNPNHEAFWKRYKAFSASAERACTGA